jgi:predicted RNase H-like nuclease
MALVAGVDGCRAGWLCMRRDPGSGGIRAAIFATARELLAARPVPCVLGIDIPIGLPDSGARACDREARARLGRPRASSVFPAPIRPALAAPSREEAARITQLCDGRRVGCQAWGLWPRIREIDAALRAEPGLRGIVREVHPELSFWAWNGARPMEHSKKTRAGRAERAELVETHFGPVFAEIRASLAGRDASDDDILDALAALWTAERIASGDAETLPPDPPRDAAGLRMEIVY